MTALSPRKAASIAWTNLVRQVRDRGSLFFVFVLPVIIIVALGLQFGGQGRIRVGVVYPAGDAAAETLVAQLRDRADEFDVRTYTDAAALRSAVERGNLEAGVVVPEGFGSQLSGTSPVQVEFVGTPETETSGYRTTIEAVVAEQATLVGAARAAVALGAGTWDQAFQVAAGRRSDVGGVAVVVTTVGEPSMFRGYTQFTFGAQTQLLLFTFLTSMTAAGQLVQSKRFGVSRRMVSTPTSIPTIIVGETLGRYLIALLQALFIVVLTSVVFGVSWGDPLAATAIVLTFALVSAAFAMLVGALSENAEQASSLGVFAGLALGALGGCMVPLTFMPDAMQTVAKLIPHSWAITGFQSLINEGGGIDTVATNVLVLLGYGVVVMALASWRFRKAIAG